MIATAMIKYHFGIICEILLLLLCAVNQIQWIEAKIPKSWSHRPVVKTDVGKVRGCVLESRTGQPFFAFRNIPYAEAPIDELRFKVRDVVV